MVFFLTAWIAKATLQASRGSEGFEDLKGKRIEARISILKVSVSRRFVDFSRECSLAF
jgi:hypothetical protein